MNQKASPANFKTTDKLANKRMFNSPTIVHTIFWEMSCYLGTWHFISPKAKILDGTTYLYWHEYNQPLNSEKWWNTIWSLTSLSCIICSTVHPVGKVLPSEDDEIINFARWRDLWHLRFQNKECQEQVQHSFGPTKMPSATCPIKFIWKMRLSAFRAKRTNWPRRANIVMKHAMLQHDDTQRLI